MDRTRLSRRATKIEGHDWIIVKIAIQFLHAAPTMHENARKMSRQDMRVLFCGSKGSKESSCILHTYAHMLVVDWIDVDQVTLKWEKLPIKVKCDQSRR